MTSAKHHTDQEEISINLTRLDARVGALEGGLSSLGVKFDSLAGIINANQRTNWPALLGLGTLLLGLIGGAWVIVDLKSQNALIPVLIQNAISNDERGTLKMQSAENKNNIASNSEDIGKLTERFKEVEQQFRAGGNYHNLFVAAQHRWNAIIWNATLRDKMGDYPGQPVYFPNFSQHLPSP